VDDLWALHGKISHETFFSGTVELPPWRQSWDCWALLKCKGFPWLAVARSMLDRKVGTSGAATEFIGNDFPRWLDTEAECVGAKAKGLHSLATLPIWRHCNSRVFDGECACCQFSAVYLRKTKSKQRRRWQYVFLCTYGSF
jgi:hypothetical protein